MNSKYLIGGAVIVALALIFVGRGLGGDTSGVQTNSAVATNGGVTQSASAGSATEGGGATLAPDFSLPSLDGETISLSSYKGEKPVVLDFFATWCPNCRRDMPKLSGFYEKYKDQVEVIGVNLNESEKKVQKFIDSQGIQFPIILDPGSRVSRDYGVQYTNYHVLISKDGSVHSVVPGDISESHILTLIES